MISTSNRFRHRTLGAIILVATLAPLCFSQNQQKIVVAPRPISVVRPSYPKEARKKKIEGPVVLRATVTLDGSSERRQRRQRQPDSRRRRA